MKPFDRVLQRFPTSQLLVWTGQGEPPIAATKVDFIKEHFAALGFADRIGFDVKVEDTPWLNLL